ncbi:MAG: hypothetical protein IJC88_00165 [Oscillospiraceae bacterium]|nr:hypothetical protein [Oscillospiraceae bacterium]
MKNFLLTVITVAFLFTFPPLGIFFMFKFLNWSDGVKKSVAVIWSVIWVMAIYMTVQETAQLAQQGM